jgi:hypothetical protein
MSRVALAAPPRAACKDVFSSPTIPTFDANISVDKPPGSSS